MLITTSRVPRHLHRQRYIVGDVSSAMYHGNVDGGQLHRLGRRLIELSRQATGEPGDLTLTPGEAAVLEDVITHPGSSVSEIAQRTSFVQSHVSASVARLAQRGVLTAGSDPTDGRRTRVQVTE